MTEDDRKYEGKWHLDKKVPIGILGGMFAQMLVFVWWAGGLSNRVDQLERQAVASAPQSERIVRLETKVDTILGNFAEIKALIRQSPAERR